MHAAAFAHATTIYLGVLAVLTGTGMAAAAWYAYAHGGTVGLVLAVALLTFLPASELATALVQRLVAARVRPRRLVRLDLQHGLPAGTCTLVVIPTMLDSVACAEEIVAHLEVQALANPDPLLHSRCSPTSRTPPRRRCRATKRSSTPRRPASRSSTAGTSTIPAAASTLPPPPALQPAKACGWDGSASAASSRS